MILENEKIMYRNVASHSYFIHYKQLENALEDFNEKLKKAGCEVKGPLFFALENMPLDENMQVELFMPVIQSHLPKSADLNFQSYFSIDKMLMSRVIGNFEVNTEFSYEHLLTHAAEKNYQLTSPIFHIFHADEELAWVDIKVKYIEQSVEPKGEI